MLLVSLISLIAFGADGQEITEEIVGKSLSEVFDFFYQPGFFKEVLKDQFILYMIQLAKIYAGAMAAIAFFSEIYNLVMNGKGDLWNIVARVIIVALILSSFNFLYFQTIKMVDSTIEVIATHTVEGAVVDLTEEKEKDEDSKWYEQLFAFVKKIHQLPVNILLVQLTNFITMAGLFIVIGVRNVSFTILAVFGPPAVVTYLHPKTEQYAIGWLKSFINVLLWPFIIVVILAIQKSVSTMIIWYDGIPPKLYHIQLFGYNVILSIMIFKTMTFIPNLLQGKGGAFTAAQTTIGAGMTALYAAKTVATGGAGAVAGAGKTAGFSRFLSQFRVGGRFGGGYGMNQISQGGESGGRIPSEDPGGSQATGESEGFAGALEDQDSNSAKGNDTRINSKTNENSNVKTTGQNDGFIGSLEKNNSPEFKRYNLLSEEEKES